MLQPYQPLRLPFSQLLNPDFQPDNQGQEYFTQIYRFGEPDPAVNMAIPGRHTVNNLTQWVDPRTIISTEFYEFLLDQSLLNSKNINGAFFMFFHRPEGRPGPIHCDWGPDPRMPRNHWAINWCWAEPGASHMMWYEPLRPDLDAEGFPVDAGRMNGWSKIPEFEPQYVREIARYSIVEPTLVRTDIPHNAHNTGTQTRWAFSLRGQRANSWEHAVERLRPWIV